ncbi:hypothetical protein WN51_06003 [Melipona quadrifasciata]|uniref:Uncharacterized protein n=1 Tax=Melipona quadrifasciata TaxID=166423 RepID=A0A0M8ZRT8_9HYME|nr:hypothetical protein WN51_06003 [Melipona quadrifasciata]
MVFRRQTSEPTGSVTKGPSIAHSTSSSGILSNWYSKITTNVKKRQPFSPKSLLKKALKALKLNSQTLIFSVTNLPHERITIRSYLALIKLKDKRHVLQNVDVQIELSENSFIKRNRYFLLFASISRAISSELIKMNHLNKKKKKNLVDEKKSPRYRRLAEMKMKSRTKLRSD